MKYYTGVNDSLLESTALTGSNSNLLIPHFYLMEFKEKMFAPEG
ncbi:MAG TPA: hypothetical protein VKZ54_08840 [Membranihabitans sp.]|nr:hypothetical protein [Membranihabitans sp.]